MNNHKKYISEARLKPYYDITKDEKIAIAVYSAFQHRSAIFFPLIQEIEIALRNEISQKLINYGLDTLNKPALQTFMELSKDKSLGLNKETQQLLKSTLSTLKKKTKSFDENDVIANLSLGFWVHFIKDISNNTDIYLKIFPNLFDGRIASHKDLNTSLTTLLTIRNRLFHHEPIWKKKNVKKFHTALNNLEKKYITLMAFLKKLAPERALLIESGILTQNIDLFFNIETFNEEIKTNIALIERVNLC